MLRNTIREAMRLYAPAAAGGPRCISKDIHHDGLRIPKGSIVLIPPYPIHWDPDYFDNPNEFLPSRWETPTPAMQNAYQPFTIGRRNCMGMSLANIEMQVVLMKLIKNNEFTVREECTSHFNFTLLPLNLRLGVKKVNYK